MCGITGHFEPHAAPDAVVIERMLRAMIARGPDSIGHVAVAPREGGHLLLGACRLAIQDLSPAGHQPMTDAETGNHLVYNGEIYNAGELRDALIARGCRFRSHCDTEVLLLGYRVWGEDVIARLRGMFAFAIWDHARQLLLLVRDRHGIKPLYYAQRGPSFVFASELRALLASGAVPRELDPTGLDSFLKFGAVQEPATMVRGVRLLPAGHLLRWTPHSLCLERYWSLPAADSSLNGSVRVRQARIEELRHTLSSAVRLRMLSDVPLGIFLSGGLDSSAVASEAVAASSRVKTFTVVFEEREYSEAALARSVAAHLGTDHHEISLSQRDLIAGLPQAVAAMDQPTVDGVNTFFVSRAAKQAGVTVALAGLGGDELFAGYRSFRMVPWMERVERWSPGWLRSVAGSIASPGAAGRGRKFAAWMLGESGFDHPFYLSRLLFTPVRVARLLKSDWLLRIEFELYAAEMAERCRLLAAQDPVNRVACLELSVYLRNTLLRDTDCMSMAHSLEVRVPLIDHLLTENMLRLPGAWKLDARQRKPLLVAALSRPLPKEVLAQPKRGFVLPWAEWMRRELRREVAEVLAEPGAVLRDALHWNPVRRLWDDFQRGRVHWSRPWMFYVLRKWTEQNLAA